MQIEMMALAKLLAMKHHRNPKLHNHAELAVSFDRFDFIQPPIIDERTQTLVAGHGRCETLQMMREAGQEAPVGIEIATSSGERWTKRVCSSCRLDISRKENQKPERAFFPADDAPAEWTCIIHSEPDAEPDARARVDSAPSGEWLVPVLRGKAFANDRERDAYVIADNQHVIGPGWNQDALRSILADLDEQEDGLAGLGFDGDELSELLAEVQDGADNLLGGGDGREVPVEGHTRQIGGHKVRPPAQMTQDDWTLHLGDCVIGMREKLADASVDAVVTDPPAGIGFMGKGWDSDKGGRDAWVAWLQEVMTEAFRVLKPGGHVLAWAIPRTSHWTMTAIENAGFEIRDVVYHAYGTGFPKNYDISKGIDAKLGAEREIVGEQVAFNKLPLSDLKERGTAPLLGGPATELAAQWDGWGTALKPAVEPWILARKPLDGTIVENVMKWGVGGLNIGAVRIGGEERFNPSASSIYSMGEKPMDDEGGRVAIGRWPAHLVLQHAPGCKPIGTVEDSRRVRVGEKTGEDSRDLDFGMGRQETTEAVTTIETYECVEDCPIRIMDEQSGITKPSKPSVEYREGSGPLGIMNDDGWKPTGAVHVHRGDGGGASRFFYVAKPSKAETEAGLAELPEKTGGELTDRKDGSKGLDNPRAGAGRGGGRRNIHPTKKPIELMRLLVRLITPPGGKVLDPFTGSGTTGMAALVEGCRFVGFELSAEYHEIASTRMRTLIEDPAAAIEKADED